MESDSGRTTSVWMRTGDVPAYEPLAGDAAADVCVVGAGIAGLTVGYLLAREGRKVVLIDDGPVAGGETSRTTAHLVNALDDRYYELERMHGERGSRLAAESHTAAVDQIEEIVGREGIDCDFERLDGYLFVAPGQSTEQLGWELRAAHRAGLTGVEYVERLPYDGYDFGAALRFPRQAQFHILKYMDGVARAFTRLGGRLHTGTRADKIEGDGETARVATAAGHVVTAGAVVVATNTPVNDVVAIHTKQAPYRTYVVGARVARGSVPRALLWDTEDPYHYVRLQSVAEGEGGGHDVLIVGGEDHKTGQAEDFDERFRRLEEWTRERFPAAESFDYHWSGQVMEPADGLGFIGRNPGDAPNVYIATGDSGNGMTHGTIAGMLLRDLILGRENAWETVYDPSRKSMLRAGGEYAKENLNVAAQYADLVTGGEVSSADEVAAGSGAVMRRGLSKVALYRDDAGALHEFSALCRHLGCVVAWNDKERSWDCPCHGSRYDPTDGHVLNGPAIEGLSPAGE
ncbi:MAG TPA: FAD-dependent oxidoreductase [Pyrinomonadaceae bacterium]|jgi:glycine/D-amino acid oxidase-like deaminating enzyme/nitrite reductase/ring-hydroxylating ferredoxin subunit